ncbi:MAG: phosphatidylglycerophosphatase A [Opitutales bacterium]
MDLKEPLWPRRLPPKFVQTVATLGPLGLKLPAPGTWGSAAGLLYAFIFFRYTNWAETLVVTLLLCYVGVGFTGEAARLMGRTDPGEVNLDEFLVMPLVFLGAHMGSAGTWPAWVTPLLGFGLFRFFDILKPLGIHSLQRWPGGWGIMADDVAAALVSCATLHLLAWSWLCWR